MVQERDQKTKFRVVVIGAGIVGASVAYHLSRRGVGVCVLERQQPCSGASGHSFAWLNAFGKEPITYHNFNRRSMELWPRFANQLGFDLGLHWGGEMRWTSTLEDAQALKKRVHQLQSWGYPSRLIEESELRKLEPGLKPGLVTAASYGEIDGQVEPQKVIAACLQRAQELGASLHTDTTVTGFVRRTADESVHRVQTSQGEFACDAVVLATGTDTTNLAKVAGLHIPQQESPGVVVRIEPHPRVLQTVSVLHTPAIDDSRLEIHLRQGTDGSLMIGEGTQESVSKDDSFQHANNLLARATHYLPALAGAHLLPIPVGYRPMPLDEMPVIGFAKTIPNLYLTLMHSGVTLAPLVGQLVTMEIVDGACINILKAYRPERFE
ncbi:MAG: FAD-dependent oxidoreductase [bacterium]|nr:FAD-dependent oxidoreductase [bacterium]